MDDLTLDMKNLTEYEHLGLNNRYNMADGHAHQSQSVSQAEIISRLPELWFEAQQAKQEDLEREFKTAFFGLAGQSFDPQADYRLLSYSASVSIEVIANFLKRHGLTVCLLNPTFDNIPCILRRVGVPVVAVNEEDIRSSSVEAALDAVEGQALFLVCPNNPTGHAMTRAEFEAIVDHCKRTQKLLIVDFSFRFFSSFVQWDQYQLLQDSGIDFITIEDTGKTWPTLDLKVGMTGCNQALFKELFDIHNDILLNVSPLILKVLTEYINDSRTRGLDATVHSVVQANREFLHQMLQGTILTPVTSTNLSVEWLRIEHPDIVSTRLWQYLSAQSVYVLPGTHFYWHESERGEKFIRVALMRPAHTFRESVIAMKNALLSEHILGCEPEVVGSLVSE